MESIWSSYGVYMGVIWISGGEHSNRRQNICIYLASEYNEGDM
jgi:hypothetical protein